MRKIKAFITTIILTIITLTTVHAEEVRAYDQCSGTYKTYTSEMKKPVKIKESKLTSLSYVKKISNITDTYGDEECTAYELDNGNGALYIGNKFKICVIIKDGKLYGRVVVTQTDNGRTVTYNYHDDECSIKGFKATEEEMIYLTVLSFEALIDFAKEAIGLSLN